MHDLRSAMVWGAAAWLLGVGAASAVEPAADRFATGRALQQRLDDEIGVSWSRAKLRDVFVAFSRNSGVAIVIDRRIDPERRVEFSASALSIRTVIEQLARRHDADVAWLGSTAYIGPAETTTKLPAVATLRHADIQKLPTSLRSALLKEASLEWSDLTEPRSLFERLCGEAGLRATNASLIPHDLWFHSATAPLPLADRLTLIAAEFDLTYRVDPAAKTITLEPWPAILSTAGTSTRPATTKPATAAPGTQVFTLRIRDVTFSKLVNLLREKHNLKIRVDEEAIRAADLTLEKLTAVDVERVTLEKLLDQAAAPLGLAAKQAGDTVVIGPRK